jgi:hypothetical protein
MAEGDRKSMRRDPVLGRIDAIRRSAVYWTMGWGYLWVALLVTVFIFLGVLLDHAFILQKWGRLAFFRAFVLSLAGGVALATLFPLVKRLGRRYVARSMERQRPELRNALISYIECRDDPQTSREIKRLMQRRVAGAVRSLDRRVVVDERRYLRLAAVIGAVVVVFLGYWALSPKSAAVSVLRLIEPRADILPPTATQLVQVEPGEIYVPAGDQPRLRALVGGVRPRSVHVVWQVPGAEERRMLLTEVQNGRWEGGFPPLLESGSYFVVAGDTRSERFGITVLPRPTVTRLRLTIKEPAYTGLPERTVEDGNVDVLTGTIVDVVAETNLPPQTGRIEFDSGRRVWLEPVRGQSALRGQFRAFQSDAYCVRFETITYPGGASFSNESPVRYVLTCREDRAPAVRLLAPPDGVQMGPTEVAQLSYAARDDYGVEQISLHFRMDGIANPPVVIATPRAPEVARGAYAWALGSIPARLGVTLTYYLEAVDNRAGLPQTGRSEARTIVIPAPRAEPAAPAAPEAPAPKPAPERTGAEGRTPPEPAPPARAGQGSAQAEPQPASAGEQARAAEASMDREQVRRLAQRLAQALRGRAQAAERTAGGPPTTASGAEPPGEAGRGEPRGLTAALSPRSGTSPALAGAPGGAESQQAPLPGGEAGTPGRTGDQGEPGQRGAGAPEGTDSQQAPLPGGEAQTPGRTGDQGEGSPGGTVASQGGAQTPRPAAGAEGRPEAQAAGASSTPGTGSGSPGSSGGDGAGREGAQGAPSGAAQGAQGAPGPSSAQGVQEGSGRSSEPGVQASDTGGEAGTADASRAGQPGAGLPVRGGSGGGVTRLPPVGEREGALPERELDQAVDELAEMLARDEVPPDLMGTLNVGREGLRRFVEQYHELQSEAEGAAAAEQPEPDGRILETGGPAGGGVSAADALPAAARKDALRSRFEGADDRLSSRYRDVVKQYYKTLSEEQ